MGRTILAFVLAVLVGALLVTAIATQINLASLTAIGAEVPLSVRADATLRDIVGFGPTIGPILLIGYLIAFGVAALVIRQLPHLRTFGYMLAGFVTIVVVMKAITFYYAIAMQSDITPVPASRELIGLMLMSLGGAGGGLTFALLARRN